MPVREATLTEIELQLEGQRLSATRMEDGWDDPRATAVIEALRSTTADRLSAVPVPGAESGRVTLSEGEHRAAVVTFHQALPRGLVAQDLAGGRPFVVSPDALDGVRRALQKPTGSD